MCVYPENVCTVNPFSSRHYIYLVFSSFYLLASTNFSAYKNVNLSKKRKKTLILEFTPEMRSLRDLLGKKRLMVFSFLEVQLKKCKCGLECLSFNAHTNNFFKEKYSLLQEEKAFAS
jgi:hypothetical protein